MVSKFLGNQKNLDAARLYTGYHLISLRGERYAEPPKESPGLQAHSIQTGLDLGPGSRQAGKRLDKSSGQ